MDYIVDNIGSDESSTTNGTWNAAQENIESFDPSQCAFDAKTGPNLDCDLAEYLNPEYWPVYQETPPSSRSTTSNGDWNLFGSSFEGNSQGQNNGLPPVPQGDPLLGCPRQAYEAAFNNSQFVAQPPNSNFVSLASIQESSPPILQDENMTLDSSPNGASPYAFASEQRLPAWGSPVPQQAWPTRSNSAGKRGSSNAARFRTAPQRTATTCSDSSEYSKSSRTTHNQIEKQYRNRLNAQFESLLHVIPQDMERDRRDLEDGTERRVSKSEVLIMAQKRIRELERQGAHLTKENRALEDNVARLKDLWISSGGVAMP